MRTGFECWDLGGRRSDVKGFAFPGCGPKLWRKAMP